MAEETQGVQNKGLLIIAVVVALLVAVVYNFHMSVVRKAGRGKTVTLLQYTRDLRPGDRVRPKDFMEITADARHAEALGNVMTSRDAGSLTVLRLVKQVRKGQYAQWGDVQGGTSEDPARKITDGMRTFTLEIEESPGTILRVGGRVDIVGIFSVGDQPPRAYTLTEGVRVIGVGGLGPTERDVLAPPSRSAKAMRSYRTITIEVTPDLSLRLRNLLTHRIGAIYIDVRNPDDAPGGAPTINSALESLASEAATPSLRPGPIEEDTFE